MSSRTGAKARPFAQTGPPLAGLAGISLVLLIGGLVLSGVLGGTIPSPYGDPVTIAEHFARYPDAVLATAVFLFASAVPLALYAATASARLRSLGVTAPGATIALAGGTLAAAMLTLSALATWVLARPAVRVEVPLVRALHDLAFLSGGVAHVVFLGLLLAGVAVPGLLLGLLPRVVAAVGLAVALVAELATVSLFWEPATALVPIGRFGGLLWLVVAGALLPRSRRSR
jgi:hypothetical protein